MVKRTVLVLMLLLSFSSSYAVGNKTSTAIVLRSSRSLAGTLLAVIVGLLKHKNKKERQKKLVVGMAKTLRDIPCCIL